MKIVRQGLKIDNVCEGNFLIYKISNQQNVGLILKNEIPTPPIGILFFSHDV